MPNQGKYRIAVIEDDEDDYLIIRDYISDIEGRSFIVDWFQDYNSAINAIKNKEYHLYFVDYFLGHKTGLDLLDAAAEMNCDEPIILLTGLGNKAIDIKAMERGATDYLVKNDLSAEKLERCIRYALERSKFLKELKTREAKYRTLFESSKDAVFITDDQLNFNEVNEAAVELLGYSENELVGRNLREFISEHHLNGRLKPLNEKSSVEDNEIKIINNNNETRECLLSLAPQRQADDETFMVHGIIHDITKIKKAEMANLQAEKLAANERLIRMLAHEIRNPLNNIILSIDQLLPLEKDEDQKNFMEIIQRNSLRINNIITELLNLAKPSELILVEHSLQEILDESLSLTNDRIKLQNIHVKKHYPSDPLILKADKEKLIIAFTNIIINAIEAMSSKGLLTITITESNDGYEVCIRDNGKGLPKEYLTRLFEPFFTMKKNGMGLGLTVAYSILQSHNAKIRAQSKENEGTEFQVS
ncbi:MAG TPA: PAS domain S-box protein, partial [Chitinophagaceae bacterium]|nr:PAS domain S-box protein [Chitinophagaceae bacterium]